MAKFVYKFIPRAFKKLEKLPKDIQRRIFTKLDYFCETNPMIYAEKLTDLQFGDFRFRVGNYRIIFDLKGFTIIILDIGHRRDIYR